MAEQELVAYCVRCRAKRPVCDAQAVYSERGQPATRGTCGVCGAGLYRPGRTPAHEGVPRPEPAPRKATPRKTGAGGKARPVPRDVGRLVIVESPAKARTIQRFLGRGYTVRASVGHVRDLLRSRLSVDVEHDFAPTYRVPKEKKEVVKELSALAAAAGEVYLATDLDREGEAIAWHVMEAAGIDEEKARRVVFHEITEPAIVEAFAHPRGLNRPLIDAQQARRILDRLVGYQISPLLWRRVQSRLSAGRVQSVAVRLVVDREREIQAFVPEEYWTLDAELAKRVAEPERPTFLARLWRIDGQEVGLKDGAAAQAVVDDLEGAAYVVSSVQRGERRRRPSPPFTTSTLQQDASRRLGFAARRTMAVAQSLYEGVNIGDEGSVGLITYMRTDSVQVSEVAQAEARAYIEEHFGREYLPGRPPVYRTRAKRAQEAHEAIRPTSVGRTPQALQPYLSRDQFRLYELIWRRFLASQMVPAVYDTMTVQVLAGRPAQPLGGREVLEEAEYQGWRYLFRARGSALKFAGFLALYEEARDESAQDEEAAAIMPPLEPGELVDLVRLLPEQHFTQPPPRYSEASLVKALEEHGIGRPSTYAPILSTIQARGYVERQNRYLVPTELGFTVNDLLVEHFPEVVDTGFTARMEADLDCIATGECDWVQVLREFYGPFSERLAQAEREMPEVKQPPEEIGELCEQCGHPLVIKRGRYGRFIACSNFPACRYTRPLLVRLGVACPECRGELVERRSRRGRTFYGCANYPRCEFTSWKRPVARPCPRCRGLLVIDRKGWLRCLRCQEQVPAGEGDEHASEQEAPEQRSSAPA
jgi:DNA topoisomerase-1